MRLKSQNEQEMQSQLVGYRWIIITWKRMKPTACFTAQYKGVTMMDFTVKEGAENMLITSIVGSFILMKSPIRQKSQIH